MTVLAWAALAQAAVAQEEVLSLPSGRQVWLQEVLTNEPSEGLAYRFRFVSEGFSTETADLEGLESDLDYLCNTYAIPRLPVIGPMPGQIIISLADKVSEFGIFDPDVSQVFEAYSVEDGHCIWEPF